MLRGTAAQCTHRVCVLSSSLSFWDALVASKLIHLCRGIMKLLLVVLGVVALGTLLPLGLIARGAHLRDAIARGVASSIKPCSSCIFSPALPPRIHLPSIVTSAAVALPLAICCVMYCFS